MTKKQSEFSKFEKAVRKTLSVSHEELKRREEDWKKEREKKKRASISPASRAANGQV